MALDPGKNLNEMTRAELCEFASALCARAEEDAGVSNFRGGIYFGNVSVNENGEVVIGPAGEGTLTGQELIYTSPELYWHGKRTPAGDVYSIGLLLYCLSEGKLPFESDDCSARKAQQLRMQGNSFRAPANAGRRMGDIILKALSFNENDRFRTPGEMKILLDSCLKNLFLNAEPCAETVFCKSDDDLSEIERMMVAIMENHNELEENAEELQEEPAPVDLLSDEAEPESPKEAELPAETEPEENESAPELPEEQPEEEPAPAEVERFCPEPAGLSSDGDRYTQWTPEEDVLEPVSVSEVYFSETDPISAISSGEDAIPETERPVPEVSELKPVKVKRKNGPEDDFPDITVSTDGRIVHAEPKEDREALRRRRRRPLIFILLLCGILIAAAIVFNACSSEPEPAVTETPLPETVENPEQPEEIPTEPEQEPEPETPPEPVEMVSEYIFVQDNVSWTEAQRACREMGGHLVVIDDAAEFNSVVTLAELNGVRVVWIGLHRENNLLAWESGEAAEELYCRWDVGEPSGYDGDIPENYVFLWNLTGNGWVYNDCINDPANEYPGSYWGIVGYVCEIEKPAE